MFIMKDIDIYVELTAPSPPAGAGCASRCSSCSGPTSQGREDAIHARSGPSGRETAGREDSDSRCMLIMKDIDIYVEVTAPSPPAGAGCASRCSSCSGPTSQGREDAIHARSGGPSGRETERDRCGWVANCISRLLRAHLCSRTPAWSTAHGMRRPCPADLSCALDISS